MFMAALLAASLLAACGGSAAPTNAPAAEPTAAVEPTTAPTNAPAAEPTAAPAAEPTAVPATEPTTVPVVAPAMTKLNLNTVTGDQLLSTIPGFSNRMVREFQEYRPYISITQFRREIGKYVDDAQVAAYEQYVYVPVKIDESDAATLQQIPGVTEAIAQELIAGRPYGGNPAFLTKLATLVSAEQAAQAAGYLE
ncbi:MAG: hypothetical protein Fur005_30430 [Roseiflexaceae bacterium]